MGSTTHGEQRAPSRLWTSERAASADRHTMDILGVPSAVLMERAAICCARVVVDRQGVRGWPVVVLCGPGNNGGDGLALARILWGWGVTVTAVLCTPERHTAAQAQLVMVKDHGVPVVDRDQFTWPPRAIICDALLGTGSRGPPRASIVTTLAWQEGVQGFRIAVDVPTGVDIDRGSIANRAFCADITVTFAASKPGLHVTPGRAYAGEVLVCDMGVIADPAEVDAKPIELVAPHRIAGWLASRTAPTHKGERGHVAVVGGGYNTPGAAVLCASAAMRAGAGLASIASQNPEVRALVVAGRPELMLAETTADGQPAPSADALVVGPGLTDPDAGDGLPALWIEDTRPAVWDASALAFVPAARAGGPRVITPHPGEACRMLKRFDPSQGWTSSAVVARRLEAALLLARKTQAVTVLKGAGTIVADPAGALYIAVVGGPELATAGTGDVLAGAIAAFLAAGYDEIQAACLGVHVHGVAGALASTRYPKVLAQEIGDALARACDPDVLRSYAGSYPDLLRG